MLSKLSHYRFVLSLARQSAKNIYDLTAALAAETALPALPPHHAQAGGTHGVGMHELLSLAADAVRVRQVCADRC